MLSSALPSWTACRSAAKSAVSRLPYITSSWGWMTSRQGLGLLSGLVGWAPVAAVLVPFGVVAAWTGCGMAGGLLTFLRKAFTSSFALSAPIASSTLDMTSMYLMACSSSMSRLSGCLTALRYPRSSNSHPWKLFLGRWSRMRLAMVAFQYVLTMLGNVVSSIDPSASRPCIS